MYGELWFEALIPQTISIRCTGGMFSHLFFYNFRMKPLYFIFSLQLQNTYLKSYIYSYFHTKFFHILHFFFFYENIHLLKLDFGLGSSVIFVFFFCFLFYLENFCESSNDFTVILSYKTCGSCCIIIFLPSLCHNIVVFHFIICLFLSVVAEKNS